MKSDNTKMFLFARWISTCYADDYLDENMKHTSDPEFDKSTAMCILNRESGYWWKEQLNHFNNVVYPNCIKYGIVKNTKQFLKR